MKHNIDSTADNHARRQAEPELVGHCFGFHKWLIWGPPFTFQYYGPYHDTSKIFTGHKQRKVCTRCGKVKERILLYLFFLSFACFPLSAQTLAPPTKPKQELKISVAEMYVRLIEERRVAWKEPEVLAGNTELDRLFEVKH